MIIIKKVDTKNCAIRAKLDTIVPESHSGGNFIFVELINKKSDCNSSELVILNGIIFPNYPKYDCETCSFDDYTTIGENEITGKEIGLKNGFRTIEEVVAYATKEIERLKSNLLEQSSSFDFRNASSTDCEVQNLTIKSTNRKILVWEAFVTRLLQNKYTVE